MKVLIAFDSFKGSLSAVEACNITAGAIKSALSSATVVTKPLADGGEGTIETILSARAGRFIECKVTGPLPDTEVDAGFAWLHEQNVAVVEMAKASGLTLLRADQMNPLRTTTYGTGQLIKAALERKPEKILLSVGGSATVDGGVGAAMALGWEFLDCNNKPIKSGPASLKDICRIVKPEKFDICPVDVLCDVTNPLIGPTGAAYVFAPQKGADSTAVEILENGMCNLCRIVKRDFAIDINIPGAGAAGGLAAGAAAFLGAKLVSGIDEIMDMIRLPEAIENCDCIITGEGCFDSQSLNGKVISGVAKIASQMNKKVYVIAGKVNLARNEYHRYGIIDALALSDSYSTDYAIKNAAMLLEAAALKLIRTNFRR